MLKNIREGLALFALLIVLGALILFTLDQMLLSVALFKTLVTAIQNASSVKLNPLFFFL